MILNELIEKHGLQETVNKYSLQIVHEDNNTYVIEDMKHRRCMTRGNIVYIAKDIDAVINYLQNLRRV